MTDPADCQFQFKHIPKCIKHFVSKRNVKLNNKIDNKLGCENAIRMSTSESKTYRDIANVNRKQIKL